jgi:hypothetical protein
MYVFNNISMNLSHNEKYIRPKMKRKSKYTFYFRRPSSLPLLPPPLHSSENFAVYEIMREIIAEPTQAKDDNITRRMQFACWIRLQTHTQNM